MAIHHNLWPHHPSAYFADEILKSYLSLVRGWEERNFVNALELAQSGLDHPYIHVENDLLLYVFSKICINLFSHLWSL